MPFILAALVVSVTFLLAWGVFPGGGSRGPHDTLASRIVGMLLAWLAEWLATTWVILAMPFRIRRPSRRRLLLPPGRIPVVLLPGLCENALTLSVMERSLEGAMGVPVRALRPVRYFTGIERLVAAYRQQIEEWMRETGSGRVDLVGHSMGGLIARHLVELGGLADRVRTVIAIGSPHQGSALSSLGPLFRNMRQMRRGSAYLESLNAASVPPGVRIVGISSTHDNLVLPWSCALSPRGDNFILRYRGHLTLILSREVVRIVARELTVQDAPEAV